MWVDDPVRSRQIIEDNQRLQLEDSDTVDAKRGPVKGFPPGSVVRRGSRGI